MDEPPIALILTIGLGSSLLASGVMLYVLRDKLKFGTLFWMVRAKVVAEADVAPKAPFAFTLRHLCDAVKLHRACLKMRVRTQGSDRLGLKCTYQVSIGGAVVAREVVSYGIRAPEPYDRHITNTFFVRDSDWGADHTRRGTIILGEVERCPLGHEMVVEGSCEWAPGNEIESLVVQLRA